MSDFTFNATSEAVVQVKAALEKRNSAPGAALRIGVKGGGCSGFMYHLEFWDKAPRDSDNIFVFQNIEGDEVTEIRILIDPKSLVYLTGSELVWGKELLSWGFKINNPQKTGSCGCKESFSVF